MSVANESLNGLQQFSLYGIKEDSSASLRMTMRETSDIVQGTVILQAGLAVIFGVAE